MIKSYRDLIVYRRAYAVSLEVHRLSLEFPRIEQYVLGDQLRRASKSIALNIAEGYGKRESVAEFKRFLSIALGSCDETRVCLDYSIDLGYITAEQHAKYSAEYDEIGKMLSTLYKNWQKPNQVQPQ